MSGAPWRPVGRVAAVAGAVVAAVVVAAVTACGATDAADDSPAARGARGMPADTVLEVVADDSIWLAPGERREWLLAPGRYRISVRTATPEGQVPLIEMAADLKCAPDREVADVIHCLVRERTPLVLRHTAVRPSTGRALAVVSIHRVP